jgi:hypothetical protein
MSDETLEIDAAVSGEPKMDGFDIPAWAGMLLLGTPIIFWSLVGYGSYRLVKRIRKTRNAIPGEALIRLQIGLDLDRR